MDNVNGDNVEWIGYPSGMTHVFCYAFYVQPPPTARHHRHQEEPDRPPCRPRRPSTSPARVSYNPGGAFSLTVPGGSTSASDTFVRGATGTNAPWTAAETIPDGFQLIGLACASQCGQSTVTYSGNDPNSTVPATTTR